MSGCLKLLFERNNSPNSHLSSRTNMIWKEGAHLLVLNSILDIAYTFIPMISKDWNSLGVTLFPKSYNIQLFKTFKNALFLPASLNNIFFLVMHGLKTNRCYIFSVQSSLRRFINKFRMILKSPILLSSIDAVMEFRSVKQLANRVWWNTICKFTYLQLDWQLLIT